MKATPPGRAGTHRLGGFLLGIDVIDGSLADGVDVETDRPLALRRIVVLARTIHERRLPRRATFLGRRVAALGGLNRGLGAPALELAVGLLDVTAGAEKGLFVAVRALKLCGVVVDLLRCAVRKLHLAVQFHFLHTFLHLLAPARGT